MPLTNPQAQQELFTANYNVWFAAIPAVNMSNAPHGCSQIQQYTANHLRKLWNPGSSPNSWNQSLQKGFVTRGVTRWVTRSVSGGNDVVDFHAFFNSKKFLWHFRIV
jgi:hypothetical protein